MAFFPVSEFFQSSGNAAAEFSEKLRDGIVTNACNIWAEYPDWIVNSRLPANSFARGFMNSVCAPIQAPVPYNPTGQVGGQCCDKEYIVGVSYTIRRCAGDIVIAERAYEEVSITGKILGIDLNVIPNGGGTNGLFIPYENCAASQFREILFSTTAGISFDNCQTVSGGDPGSAINVDNSEFAIVSIRTADGSPDDCDGAGSFYPPNPPGAGDFTQSITININDGYDANYVQTWNRYSENYNFPMSFKVGGINATLDIGGLTIYGNPSATQPGGNDIIPDPGADGGVDEVGDVYNFPNPDSGFPSLPILVSPENIAENIAYLVCEEGALEVVEQIVKSIPGFNPILKFLIQILSEIIAELCKTGEGGDLAFPEVYPILPGTERPAIVYVYKELVGGVRQRSTYSSTVSNPTAAAIAAIDSVVVDDKVTGPIVASIRMLDGGRLVSTGITETAALSNLNFLISQAEPTLIPSPQSAHVVYTNQVQIATRILNCSQIEYYPNGKAAGVTPSIQRFIDAPTP